MLGYTHINLKLMLKRVATDSLYIQKSMLHKLESVEAYVPTKSKEELWAMLPLEGNGPSRAVGSGQWQDNGKLLYLPDH